MLEKKKNLQETVSTVNLEDVWIMQQFYNIIKVMYLGDIPEVNAACFIVFIVS